MVMSCSPFKTCLKSTYMVLALAIFLNFCLLISRSIRKCALQYFLPRYLNGETYVINMFHKCIWWTLPLTRSGQMLCLHNYKSLRQISTARTMLCKHIKAADGYKWLFECAPSFHIDGSNVHVLREPSDFYHTLKENIKKARKRITLASLYLGTGPLEKELVSSVEDRLLHARELRKGLTVRILLDHVRGSRGKSENSRTMLLPLITHFPGNVEVFLYHSPDFRGLLRRCVPEKFNETIGVTHLKVYLTDDTFILSGANLSQDYFLNRQDRFIMIKDSPSVADYLDDLVSTVSAFSLRLHPDNTTTLADNFPSHPYRASDRGQEFKTAARSCVENFIEKWKRRREDAEITSTKNDTLIFPLLQMGPLGITQDERVTSRIFASGARGAKAFLATGYFNLTENYLKQIMSSEGRFDVLCAHPEVNGFYKARGVIGGVTDAFTQFAKEFYYRIQQSTRKESIFLKEYLRRNWTFHVKGLWYYPPGESLPCLTLIGSPNFGHRSVTRDLENQVVLITDNVRLRQQLRQECDHVYGFGVKVDETTFESKERRVPFWAWLVTRLTRSFF